MSLFFDRLKNYAGLSDDDVALVARCLDELAPQWAHFTDVTQANQIKVLEAFQKNQVADFHLNGSTGYGYGDTGRDVLERVWADIFCAEKALVRSNLVSGTHAIATVLFGILRPGDEAVSISGLPYDTLQTVIGKSDDAQGTLREFGIHHKSVPLKDNDFDEAAIRATVTPQTKMVMIQRSRGYEWRDSLSIEKIARACEIVKSISPEIVIFVDNCYGEFVEEREPLEVGADIIAGSLIKNPGGGLAPRGGYIAGREDLVNVSAQRLTAPGISDDVSSSLDFNRPAFQGLFMAPLIVEQALKGASFAAAYLGAKGYIVSPTADAQRTDIIQCVAFGDPDKLRKFCQGIQAASALESYVTPYDDQLPGYDDPVIMAGGTFIQGSSIELSIDGPMRAPFIGYMQGGLSISHIIASVCLAAKKMEG
jgi:cystathionine beta-lyase family protein involved in aluminum resistance